MLHLDEEKLIDSYNKYQSIRKVGIELGISHETARYKLKRLGILNKLIVYTWDNNLFSQDSINSFYWAGFVAADGCVKLKNNKYKQLGISLAIKDIKHLEKFKECIKFTGPITTKMANDKYEAAELCISSAKLFDDIARFNIVPRKSLVLTFPEWLIEHPQVNHFMRGYFDGDGSFYIQKLKDGRTVRQLCFSLRGTKEFLDTYSKILGNNCNFDYKKPRQNSGIYTLEYGGNVKVQKIVDLLYKNSTNEIRLDRKYNLVRGV